MAIPEKRHPWEARMRQVPLVPILASLMLAQSSPTTITIPLEDGKLGIVAQFIRVNKYGDYVPELSFGITNETSSPWRSIQLRFDIGGICNGETRQWSVPAVIGIGHSPDRPMMKTYADTVISLVGKVDGCTTEIIRASLVAAENSTVRINGQTGERVDVELELQQIKAKREAEAAAEAERQRIRAEAKAKADAEEEKRLAAEAKEEARKEALENARLTKLRAIQAAKDAEERRRIRAACSAIYRSTADRKVSDLTVKEEQQVRACQALGLYPPQ